MNISPPDASPTMWATWLRNHGYATLFGLPTNGGSHPYDQLTWNPSQADRRAAWKLYTELRTRITTQPLAYRAGNEERALMSVYEIFPGARAIIEKHHGCTHLATLTAHVLNVHVRPFTADWHKRKEDGNLARQDVRLLFRHNLAEVQEPLRKFMRLLGELAEGDGFVAGTESGIEARNPEPFDLGAAIPFGIADGRPEIANRAEINEKEKGEVLRRRTFYKIEGEDDAVGLALSGGGIRSATFGLGVVQQLARRGLLKQVDFLSTVSGGGYLGSFISSFLNDPHEDLVSLDTVAGKLPFGAPRDPESDGVRHLRNHSKYLVEGGLQARAMILALLLYGIAVSLFLMMPVVLAAVVAVRFGWKDFTTPQGYQAGPITLGIACVLGVAVALLPWVQNVGRNARHLPRVKRAQGIYEWGCVALGALLVALLLLPVLPLAYEKYVAVAHAWGSAWTGSGGDPAQAMRWGSGLVLLGAAALPFALAALAAVAGAARPLGRVLLGFVGISGPFFFFAAFLVLCWLFVAPESKPQILGLSSDVALVPLFVVVSIYSAFVLNINFASPHRYYRNRLSRTYLTRSDPKEPEQVAHMDRQRLSDLTRSDLDAGQPGPENPTKAPYHLINAALNIPGCTSPNLRGRNTDFFVFSKHFCGSPIAGYFPTTQWEALDAHLDLGTAMAISAAAAAPRMGVGTMENFTFLLAILNIRLGYWACRPDKGHLPAWVQRWLLAPGWVYFMRELTGMMDEHTRYLNLSDGGHIENLGIYELLRRRCKYIIAVDGEADPTRSFGGLLTLTQLASIDLGVRIEPSLADLRADADGLGKAHFALVKIEYPDGKTGFLLYIKSSMTGNESEFLHKYRAENPTFPHQSTADQLFDEAQFEAYRALGQHIVEDHLFRPEVVGDALAKPTARPTVREWICALAGSLLERPPATVPTNPPAAPAAPMPAAPTA